MTRRFAGRAALVLFGLCLPLCIAEIALQLSSRLYRGMMLATRAEAIDLSPATRRVLCVGDSNTFGVRVAPQDSYPGQLGAMWKECARHSSDSGGAEAVNTWQVLNRGIPGQNTAQIRASLPELLEWSKPAVVIVLAGINNTWNQATALEDRSLIERSRLVRLAKLAWNNWRAGGRDGATAGRGEAEVAAVARLAANDVLTEEQLVSRTVDDLVAIAAASRESGATPVFMTYPGRHPHARPLNDAARAAAARAGVTLVDHDAAFAGYVAKYGYASILFEDSHPAEAGYRLMARDIVSALSDAGIVAATLPPDRYEPKEFQKPATIEVEHDASGRPIALRLAAEPLATFQVYVSPVREPELDLGSRRVPVGVHPWLDFCRSHGPFHGALDAGGRARVELPAEVTKLAPGERLYAAFVTSDVRALHADPTSNVRSISSAVVIERR